MKTLPVKRLARLALLAIGAVAFVQSSSGQILFTTTNDFSGWSGRNGITAAPTQAWDADNGIINGLGDDFDPGQKGGPGSLLIKGQPLDYMWAYIVAAHSPDLDWSPGFMQAVDPGSTAEGNGLNKGPGQTVAYNGTMDMVYTMPTDYTTNTFKVGIVIQCNDSWSYFFPNATILTTINGLQAVVAQIPYEIKATPANTLTNFTLYIACDTASMPGGGFDVDMIQIVQIAPVPEPSSLALFGLGALGFALFRRRS